MVTSSVGGVAGPTPARPFCALTFADRLEAAAFVAALSRAVLAPFCVEPTESPAEIWVAPGTGDERRVLMNDTAAAVATSVFHLPPAAEVVRSLPIDARLAFRAGQVPALGVSEALAIV
jgi:hypothetical protein